MEKEFNIITLTEKQQKVVDLAYERFAAGEKYTVISGVAGSGKSTAVSYAIKKIQQDTPHGDELKVAYCAFAGKAVQVLKSMGNDNAMTLHSLMYAATPKKEGGYYFQLRTALEYNIIVLDEISMVPKSMLDELFGFDVYVICLGDPFQLPPIEKKDVHDLLENPHIFLDEIVRQASESSIIKLTTDIRQCKNINNFENDDEVKVLTAKELSTGMLLWADQVVCATNATRVNLNNIIREQLGYKGLPQEGEKVICLKNYRHILSSDNEAFLTNGTVGTIHNIRYEQLELPYGVGYPDKSIDVIICDFHSDYGGIFYNLILDFRLFTENQYSLEWKYLFKMLKVWTWKKYIPLEFTYGYTMTAWKAQGSDWDKVVVLEEPFPYDKEEHMKFLYTAATRAKKKLVLLRGHT